MAEIPLISNIVCMVVICKYGTRCITSHNIVIFLYIGSLCEVVIVIVGV